MSTKLDWTQVIKGSYNESQEALQVTNLGSLVPESFDFISASYPSATQEVYTYKTGGSGGTTVATVTINYVDATKEQIVDITRS